MIDKTDPTNRDTVPAMLTPGEFVLNKEATEMYGPIIQQMNNNGLQQRSAENKAMEANMGGGVKYYSDGAKVEYDFNKGLAETAKSLNINPIDLLTIMSYETAGTLNPLKKGPTTKWGQHRGYIQFGEPQAEKYGVDFSSKESAMMSQLGSNGAIVKYFRDHGFKEGMGMMDLYSIVNAGAPGKFNLTDENSGGASGTIRDKVTNQMGDHREKALKLFGDYELPEPVVTNELSPSQSVRPQTRPETLQEKSQPIVMEQPSAALPNPTGYGGYTPQQFLDEAGRMNTTTVPSMEQAPPMMQEFIAPLPNAGADASFGSAFKEARGQMGAGQVFDYGGKQYTTNFAEEEDMMTANMGGKACSCGKKKVCGCGLGMTYANMGGDIPIQNLNIGDWVKSMANSVYSLIPQKNFEGYGTELLPRWKQELQDRELDPRLSGEQGSQMYPNSIPKIEEVLPPVNSDQSLLDGSSQSVKDSQRMMMFNNPIPNALPVPNGNPMPPAPPSVDFPPMDESFRSVPQSVQDSQRMIDINADNGFIPKPNIDVPVEQVSTEAEAAAERISEEISDLRLRMSVMPSGSEMRAILQTQVDQKLGQIASMGQDLNSTTLPVPKQTGVNTGLINAKTELEEANLNLQKAKTPEDIQIAANEIAAAELKVENSATIPEIQTSMITKANTESLQSRRNLLSSINNQINNSNNPRVIAALNEKRKVIQSDIKDLDTDLMLEEGGVNVLGERGRRSPYLQYGDMVQSRVDALEKSTEPEGSSLTNTNNTTTTTPDNTNDQVDSTSIQDLGNKVATGTPAQVTEAKGLLSSVFGDLFDSKELMRAAIMYLGGRATGMSGNQALAFAGKTYLAREASTDAALKKHINKLITDGNHSAKSIQLYKETGDISVLEPKGVTYVSMGETETYYNTSTGRGVQAQRVKGSDGSYRWQAPNGQFLRMNMYHQDKNRSEDRPRSETQAEQESIKDHFTEIQKRFGMVKGAKQGEPAKYKTDLTPGAVSAETMTWAMKNNVPVNSVNLVLTAAYERALADAERKNKPVTAKMITGYLNNQWIQMSAGDPTDFKTSDDKPIETTSVNEWVNDLQSKVSEVRPDVFKGMNAVQFSTWLRDTDLTKAYSTKLSEEDRKNYIKTANKMKPPISGYMLFMKRKVQDEYRLLLETRSQGTS